MRKIVGRRSRMWHSVMLITIMIRAIFGVKLGMLLAGIAHPLGPQLLHPKSVWNHPKAHQHARQIVSKLSSHHGSTPTQQSPDACLPSSNKRRDLHIANYPPSQWKHMPSAIPPKGNPLCCGYWRHSPSAIPSSVLLQTLIRSFSKDPWERGSKIFWRPPKVLYWEMQQ